MGILPAHFARRGLLLAVLERLGAPRAHENNSEVCGHEAPGGGGIRPHPMSAQPVGVLKEERPVVLVGVPSRHVAALRRVKFAAQEVGAARLRIPRATSLSPRPSPARNEDNPAGES
jgi:hypothetical protein